MLGKLRMAAALLWIGMDTRITNWIWNKRTLALPYEITPEACEYVMSRLDKLANESDEPILLMCDSSGGTIFPVFTLVERIVACRAPVVTLIYYQACSAALHVFAAGHLRLMRPGALIGTHACVFGDDTHLREILGRVTEPDQLDELLESILQVTAEHTKGHLEHLVKRELPDELFQDEMAFTGALESRKLGFADGLFFRPPIEAWWKARKLRPFTENLVTT